MAVKIGVSGQDPEQDHTVGTDLDNLGDAGVSVVVADDQVVPDRGLDAGCGVVEVAVRQATLVDAGKVHPHVPRPEFHHPIVLAIHGMDNAYQSRPGFDSGGSNAKSSRARVSAAKSGNTMSKWGWSPVARRANPAAWTRATVDRRTWP